MIFQVGMASREYLTVGGITVGGLNPGEIQCLEMVVDKTPQLTKRLFSPECNGASVHECAKARVHCADSSEIQCGLSDAPWKE